jgi:wyosine [tRNA(Phe)-imidazoG37] synthetase (radical SAM superfamily)
MNRSGAYRYLFGPVPSRRLGLSLGIDCMPAKTCSLNCVYCECGRTTDLTLEVKEYIPGHAIRTELARYLSNAPRIDAITVTGSGEPTLNSALGEISAYLKSEHPQYTSALLTNATLFTRPDVRERVRAFDLILPSLDAVSEKVFSAVNRPAPGLHAGQVVEGLVALSREYSGRLWVEVFIVPGVNDTDDELKRIKKVLDKVKPQRVQLNTLDRPGTADWVVPATPGRLVEIARYFQPLPVEILSRQMAGSTYGTGESVDRELLLTAVARRPATVEDIAVIAKSTINAVQKVIAELSAEKKVLTERVGSHTFYRRTPEK